MVRLLPGTSLNGSSSPCGVTERCTALGGKRCAMSAIAASVLVVTTTSAPAINSSIAAWEATDMARLFQFT